jgi:hypothetical protein
VLFNRTIKTRSGDFWTKAVGVFTEALEMNLKVVNPLKQVNQARTASVLSFRNF